MWVRTGKRQCNRRAMGNADSVDESLSTVSKPGGRGATDPDNNAHAAACRSTR
jgi:hypothetical protein